jgi:peptide chain release factor 3
MTFQKDGVVFNLLDTPGHEDFSEDTYRTLTAVDSAIMVIDAAKGIEPQTRKLFEVCRMRSVPIITFVNKVDREGRSVFETLDEVADALALDVVPMSWPVGMGGLFQGVLNLATNTISRPEGDSREFLGKVEPAADIPEDIAEEIELAQAGYPEFDLEAYRHGDLTPVFFGSALKNFGVAELIDAIAKYAPPPRPQSSEQGTIEPERPDVTGFVFKVQANMDPQHRDRIAFMRMVSGTFKRGMKLTPSGLGKPIAVHSPILFFAQDREIADTAEAGDIIGIPNHGTLRVGDTLSERNDVRFTGLPNFAPEILRRVALKDPTKTKQLRKALDDLSEEGVIQVFYPEIGAQWIVGVVGQLQLDVLISRLEAEYKVEAVLEPSPFDTARWLKGTPEALKAFADFNLSNLAKIGRAHV